MAQYKVPQNVESEDKILGPLSLKQFIYVLIALMWGFLMWRIFIHAILFAIVFTIPVSGTFLALGLIQREEQSFENYFLAMVRFIIVPRTRVWHKDSEREAVVTAAPKPQPRMVTRNPEQVRGQLEKLALIVDTRGRVPKPADIQLPDEANQAATLSARVNVSARAPELPLAAVRPGDDILDMQNNRQAKAVGQLLENVEADIRSQARSQMQQSIAQPGSVIAPAAASAAPVSTGQAQDDILDLAMHNSGLSVAQIATAANRNTGALIENQPVQIR